MSPRHLTRLIAVGGLIAVIYEAALLILGFAEQPGVMEKIWPYHVLAALVGCALMVSGTRVSARFWRPAVFASSLALIGCETAASIVSNGATPSYAALLLLVMGVGALVPWSADWQLGLGAVTLAAFGIHTAIVPSSDALGPFRWLGLLAGCAIALVAVKLGQFYRQEIRATMRGLNATEERLRAELARSADLLEERGRDQERLRHSEEAFRTIFDATAEAMVFTRLYDYQIIHVNRATESITGYNRRDFAERQVEEVRLWARREDRKNFYEMLLSQRAVDGLETELKRKDGTVYPARISSVLVEVNGEPFAVTIGRDISVAKIAEREARAAREFLAAKVAELEAREAELSREISRREDVERRLLDREATLAKIFDSSIDGTVVRSLASGRMLEVNAAFLKRHGFKREEVIGRSISELAIYPVSVVDRFEETLRRDGMVRDFETEFRCQDGSTFIGQLSAVTVELSGEPCMIVQNRDVTRQRRIERELIAAREALAAQVKDLEASQATLKAEVGVRQAAEERARANEEKLRKILETSLNPISIRRLSDGCITEANSEFLRVTGRNRGDLIGRTIEEIKHVVPDEAAQRFYRELTETGQVSGRELNRRAADGTVVPMVVSARVAEIDGELCVVASSQDIVDLKHTEAELIAARERLAEQVAALEESRHRLETEVAERKAAEERARQSEDTLRKIFEASLEPILVHRLSDGRILSVNAEFLNATGLSLEETLGKTPLELGLWTKKEQAREFVRQLRSQGFARNLEFEYRDRRGGTRVALISAVVVELNGELCIISATRQIDELKKTQAELIRAREKALSASRAKSEFLSSMSHEIRTPMNAILGMAEALWGTRLTEDQRSYLQTMRANGDALLQLIDDILDLAKVEAGHLTLEQTTFDLDDLIVKCAGALGVRAHGKRLELIVRIMPDVARMLVGDPLRLRQILVNLMGNAIKFTERGQVVLTVSHASGKDLPLPEQGPKANPLNRVVLCFTVADTGIGIPPDKLQTIFSSFTQADSSTARRFGGSGLGLAIVKRLVELYSGRVSVESEPGRGSTFRCVLPLAAAADAAELKAVDLTGVRVLVADDNTTALDALREALEAAGASVTAVGEGEQALSLIGAASGGNMPYDVGILDAEMPAACGVEIGKLLGFACDRPATGVLFVLAASSESGTASLVHASCVSKPAVRYELLEAVGKTMGRGGEPKEQPGAQSDKSKTTEQRPLRILLAEDSPDNRLVIQAYLKETPYQLDFAEDGLQVVEKVKARNYDLVLMDIQMPELDGYEATERIRLWEREQGRRRTPIVALTASVMPESIEKSLDAGCDSNLTKPIKKQTLLDTIHSFAKLAEPAGAAIAGTGAAADKSNGAAGPAPIVVTVDRDLSDLVPEFLERKRQDAAKIQDAAARGDFDELGQIGHRIKGEGGSYGFDPISMIGANLEQAAAAQDAQTAQRLAAEMTDYLARVQVVYSAPTS